MTIDENVRVTVLVEVRDDAAPRGSAHRQTRFVGHVDGDRVGHRRWRQVKSVGWVRDEGHGILVGIDQDGPGAGPRAVGALSARSRARLAGIDGGDRARHKASRVAVRVTHNQRSVRERGYIGQRTPVRRAVGDARYLPAALILDRYDVAAELIDVRPGDDQPARWVDLYRVELDRSASCPGDVDVGPRAAIPMLDERLVSTTIDLDETSGPTVRCARESQIHYRAATSVSSSQRRRVPTGAGPVRNPRPSLAGWVGDPPACPHATARRDLDGRKAALGCVRNRRVLEAPTVQLVLHHDGLKQSILQPCTARPETGGVNHRHIGKNAQLTLRLGHVDGRPGSSAPVSAYGPTGIASGGTDDPRIRRTGCRHGVEHAVAVPGSRRPVPLRARPATD